MMASSQTAKSFAEIVKTFPKGRFNGIVRNYTNEEVDKLRGSVHIEYTLAKRGAIKLWQLLNSEPYINALGAVTGNQAMQMARAGLKAIYLSGWQVAADANSSGAMYPDQSLYPSNSGPDLVRKINKTLQRADQIETSENNLKHDWFLPIVADAEAGFGGPLNCFEIMKAYIEAGAAGVHYEDQLASEKKCGHLGGKVLIPSLAHERNMNAARLAADVCGVPVVLVARTDAESAQLITSDVDERDRQFIDYLQGRTSEGFYRLKPNTGLQHCIQRGLAYAKCSDLLWWETSTPDLKMAKEFAEAVRKQYPDKLMAYNCSPSFNWERHLSKEVIAKFQRELGAMGYKFQFVTLAGFHALNYSMFDLAQGYRQSGMTAYSKLQQAEFDAAKNGYTAVKHQREVGTGYFDLVSLASAGGKSSTTALKDSTEKAQFEESKVEQKQQMQQVLQKPKFESPAATEIPVPITTPSSIKGTGVGATMSAGGPTKMPIYFQSRRFAHNLACKQNPTNNADNVVLTDGAKLFLEDLQRQFGATRQGLLDKRKERQAKLDAGEKPYFLKDTQELRNSNWTIKNTPDDLQDRRVEITGPVDRKMVINALNSSAKVYMADFEDSTTPTWRNVIDGQKNLIDAVRRQIDFVDSKTEKAYKLKDKHAVLMVRPRGWHLQEKHFSVDGSPMSGSLFDFGLFFYHNAKELMNKGTAPYFYLPKLQSHEEAKLWDDVFRFAQQKLGIPVGTIKATVLIEHMLATFECDEILHALKDHIVGLNCGRWDYIFSYIKTFRNQKMYLLPDRSQVTMTVPFMRAYAKLIVQTSHKRLAHAMGGMAANIPIKNDQRQNDIALELVRADKERELADGHDGTWVAHPGLVPLAGQIFDKMGGQNQVRKPLEPFTCTPEHLIACPEGLRTALGLRRITSVTLGYLEAWLRGTGCVPLFNLMEDAATAEISRAQIWQWLHHGAKLSDGRQVTLDLVRDVINEEKLKWRADPLMANSPTLDEAADLLLELVAAPELPDFLTLSAYDRIVAKGE